MGEFAKSQVYVQTAHLRAAQLVDADEVFIFACKSTESFPSRRIHIFGQNRYYALAAVR
jgi:hypothetical protein